MKKIYVLDTNVFISDPMALWAFEDNDIIVPMVVIEELDKLKNRPDVGQNARQVSRQLDDLRSKGNLLKGVELPGGGTLRIKTLDEGFVNYLPLELRDLQVHDNVLIATAGGLRERLSSSDCMPVVLVSKDVNVRIKCDSIGLESQDYLKNRATTDKKQFYRGVEVFDDPKWSSIIASIYTQTTSNQTTTLVPREMSDDRQIFPNQIIVVKDGQSSAISRVIDNSGELTLKRILDVKDVMGLKPRNKEQNFALSLLMDPDVKLVTLTGPAGCVDALTRVSARINVRTSRKWQLPVPADTYDHVDSEDK